MGWVYILKLKNQYIIFCFVKTFLEKENQIYFVQMLDVIVDGRILSEIVCTL